MTEFDCKNLFLFSAPPLFILFTIMTLSDIIDIQINLILVIAFPVADNRHHSLS